ncbi:CobW family GTP-binding protein [Veillonella sp.]
MIPITIISGFLGAGKTTYLQYILNQRNTNERILIIENDFGETSLDSQQLSTSGAVVREVTSGCICCSLQGNFKDALVDILSTQDIDKIYIEPSGVSKLSEIINTCKDESIQEKAYIDMIITIVDAMQAPMAIKNFGPFFKDQIKYCYAILLSHIEDDKQTAKTKDLITDLVPHTPVYTDIESLQQDVNQIHQIAHVHNHHSCTCHSHTHDCNHHHHEHEQQPFISHTFYDLQMLEEQRWGELCNTLSPSIIRAKGIVPTPAGPMELQYTPQNCSMSATSLDSFHLVIIGTEIDMASISRNVSKPL